MVSIPTRQDRGIAECLGAIDGQNGFTGSGKPSCLYAPGVRSIIAHELLDETHDKPTAVRTHPFLLRTASKRALGSARRIYCSYVGTSRFLISYGAWYRQGGRRLQAARAKILGVWDSNWETGDRFEVQAHSLGAGTIRLALPPEMLDPATTVKLLEDSAGLPLLFVHLADENLIELASTPAQGASGAEIETIWLEYLSPNRYRLIIDWVPAHLATVLAVPANGAVDAVADREIEFPSADFNLLHHFAPPITPRDFELALRAVKLASHPGFDSLITLPIVPDTELLQPQIRSARTVLRRLRGRALLCDEVGLGKTIEAGLVLSELLVRGLARSVLVLTPPSLITQWQGELRRKFGIDLISHDDPAFRQSEAGAWECYERVIVSQHTAKREPHRSAILNRKWDIVIVDEAHHLRNRTTALWRSTSEIQ